LSPCQKATNYLLLQFNSRFKFSNWSPFQTRPFVDFRSISFSKCFTNCLQIVSMSKCNQLFTSPVKLFPNCLQIVSKLSLCQNATNCSLLQFNSPYKFSKWSPFQTIPFVNFRSISFSKCSPNCLHFFGGNSGLRIKSSLCFKMLP
jgi:hypothetical protein